MSSQDFMGKIKDQMQLIKDKTGIDPKIILGILGGAALLTLTGFLDSYITCIVGIVLPTYWSLKAIESAEGDDDRQWLTYWIVYGVFNFLDLFAHLILKFIPFYFFLKLIFLIWCFMPNTRGAAIIYDKIISKIFKKYETQIDKGVHKVMKKAQKAMGMAKEKIDENKGKILEAGINAGAQINEFMNEASADVKKTD
ncbi:MAG: HVA22/TB2/DP1 family protein [archaeon]|nr:HVA22/TB2/DP1 family protein [archaeon]